MTASVLKLQYMDTVGFTADQGGRGFLLPTDMVVRSDGRIFVASRSNTGALEIVGIQMVTREHGFFGQVGERGEEPGQMVWPSALALDSDENLYLADDFLQRITAYDREGNLISIWGAKGSGDGELNGPSGMVFDSDDNLVLVDHRNHRVQKFTKDGRFLDAWGSFGHGDGQFNLPWGITRDRQGDLYVADWRTTASRRWRRTAGS